jgi:hypothetical protein
VKKDALSLNRNSLSFVDASSRKTGLVFLQIIPILYQIYLSFYFQIFTCARGTMRYSVAFAFAMKVCVPAKRAWVGFAALCSFFPPNDGEKMAVIFNE